MSICTGIRQIVKPSEKRRRTRLHKQHHQRFLAGRPRKWLPALNLLYTRQDTDRLCTANYRQRQSQTKADDQRLAKEKIRRFIRNYFWSRRCKWFR